MEEGTHGQDPMHQPQCFIFLIQNLSLLKLSPDSTGEVR